MIYKDKVYTVAGDFHENADALDHLLSEYKNTQIVLLGDYFDSIGGNAQEMAEVMTDLVNGEYHLKYDPILIRGNHDDMMLHAAKGNPIDAELWLSNGGSKTIKQLGYKEGKSPERIEEFMQSHMSKVLGILEASEYYEEHDNIVFVHGGFDMNEDDPINDTPIGDMMWLRDYYYFEPLSHTPLSNKIGKTVVSGHTPTQEYGLGGKIMRLNAVGDNQDMTRYVIDGGSNSGEATGHVNIVQFTETGKFIDVEEV